MVPVLIQLGPITLYSFGAMMALAFLAAGAVLADGLESRGFDRAHASSIVWWAAIGGLVGSRLLAIANEWSRFVAEPLGYLITGAGFVWYGGLLGGMIAVTAYLRLHGVCRGSWSPTCSRPGSRSARRSAASAASSPATATGARVSTLPWAMAYPTRDLGWDKSRPAYASIRRRSTRASSTRYLRSAAAAHGAPPERWAPGSTFFAYLILTGSRASSSRRSASSRTSGP